MSAVYNVGLTREEHLARCKQRALEYLDRGDIVNAVTSMLSDLRKHPGTESHSGIQLGVMMLVAGLVSNPNEARRFIEGFN